MGATNGAAITEATRAPAEPDWLVKHGPPANRWRPYDASRGDLAPAWHVRHDRPDGTKVIVWKPPLTEVAVDLADLVYGGERMAGVIPGETIVVVEGEKSADAVRRAGLHALGTVCGASTTPGPAVVALLEGHSVVLWPDNDDVGRAHMERVGRALEAAGVAALSIVRWPEAPEHGDAADTTAERIRELVDDAARRAIGPLTARDIEQAASDGSGLFRSARALVAQSPATVDWLVRAWVALGALHEVVGLAKAAGKSTFVMFLIAAVLDGRHFLDEPTTRTAVVLLTEQPMSSLREILARAGLADREDLWIATWRSARGVPWPDVVALAVEECRRIGARLLVVDTLPQFAGIRGDAENASGAALEAIEPLQAAAADGLAVIVVRHERKSGGEVGNSARGSSAFTGAVDVVLSIKRPDNAPRPGIRTLAALSRFDQTPTEVMIELTDAGYVVLGDRAAVAYTEAYAGILDVLPEGTGLRETELSDRVGGRKSTVGAALRELLAKGEVVRDGAGRPGSPFIYRRAAAGSAMSSPVPLMGRDGGRPTSGDSITVGDRMAAILAPIDDDALEESADGVTDDVFAAVDADDAPGDVWSIFGEPAVASA